MAIINPVSYMQAREDHTAQTDRLATSGLLMPFGTGNTWLAGTRQLTDMQVSAQDSPNMSVRVTAGQAYVRASSSLQGTYHVVNDGAVTLPISAAHASLTRHDLVVVRVYDSAFTGSDDEGTLEVVEGTPSGAPADPVVSGTHLVLSRVVVTGSSTAVTNGDIQRVATRTAGLGGIPSMTTSQRNAWSDVEDGVVIYNRTNGTHEARVDGSWQPLGRGVWSNWTPTWSALPTSSSSGEWIDAGGIIHCTFAAMASGTISSGAITIDVGSLPVPPAAPLGRAAVGTVVAFDDSVGSTSPVSAVVTMLSSGSLEMVGTEPSNHNRWRNTYPFTWAANDSLRGSFSYRPA